MYTEQYISIEKDNIKRFFYLSCAFLFVVLFSIKDIFDDIAEDGLSFHVTSEIFVVIISFTLFFILSKLINNKEIALKSSEIKLSTAQQHLEEWKKESNKYILGLQLSIENQFKTWNLSPAETEIGFLLIKGLSMKEIADIRGTSEKTIRAQSLSLYTKSGLAGRNELSAFFLEDLLSPSR